MSEPTFSISTSYSVKRISDLLCCAFEGGSNYWYMIEKFNKPEKLEFRTDKDTVFPHLDYPLNAGGSLIITATGDKTRRTLDLEACVRGLKIMAEKYPKHFADWVGENDDATTGDVYLQCCLFGEVVYG